MTGKATINDLLTANKGLTVNGGALTVLKGNSLNAQGGATISGAPMNALNGASITGDLTVTGKATINDLLTANKGLTVNGGALTVLKGNSLNAQGGATISGAPMNALNGASITGDLTVTGKATINDLLTANKGLIVNGGALTVLKGNSLNAQGGATISGSVGIGTDSPGGKLDVLGDIRAGNSDIYFTKTDHKHTGFGNTDGYAAIENAEDYGALMILGRTTPKGRKVQLWDYLQVTGGLQVNGGMDISGSVGIGTDSPGGKLDVRGDIRAGNSDIYFTKTDHKHTGFGNTDGYAAIENAEDFGALMILGRTTPKGRIVKLYDKLNVKGGMDISGSVGIGTESPEAKLHVAGNLKADTVKTGVIDFGNGISIRAFIENGTPYIGIYNGEAYQARFNTNGKKSGQFMRGEWVSW